MTKPNKSVKFLGYVSARIISVHPPARTDVLWAKPDGTINDKPKYLLYVWDGKEWVPLGGGGSGDYDTELPDGIETPGVGGILPGTQVSDLRGLSLVTLWDRLLFPAIPPTYTPPSASLAGSDPKVYEVGVVPTILLTGTFNQNDAGALTGFVLKRNGLQIATETPHSDTFGLSSPGSAEYEGTFTYDEGNVKNDTHGQPHPDGRIPAGSITTAKVKYEWIYPYYFGSSDVKTGIDVASGTKILSVPGSELTVEFPEDGPKFYWLAVPAGSPVYQRYYITEISKGPIGAGNAWEPPVSITKGGVNYDLYLTGYITQFNLPVKFLEDA